MIFRFLFGQSQSKRKKRDFTVLKRRLGLEILETRELLSVSPLLPRSFELPPNQFESSDETVAIVTAIDWFENLSRADGSEEIDNLELTESGDAYAGQWIVQLDSKTLQNVQDTASSVSSLAEQFAPYGISVLSGLGNPGLLLTQVDAAETEQSELLASLGFFEYWQPNYVIESAGIVQEVNDPNIDLQWGLDFINVGTAWNVSDGSGVVVAVLDSGITLTHPDLQDNIWTNTMEIAGDGIDNDGNGFIDDVYGWNFVSNNSNTTDADGHGTHVAGIIGAVADNSIGGSGVAPGVEILPVKVISGSNGSTANIVSAINYVLDLKSHGVNLAVINMSLGYYNEDPAVGQAIKKAGDTGIVVVASAGNEGKNNDAKPHYPSGYNNFDNLISVAAIDSNGQLASYSNYGQTTVDLAAPGTSIYSTTKNGSYGLMNGTSMAAPFVSAAVAILVANNNVTGNSILSPATIKEQILSTVTPQPSLSGKVASGGSLNLANFFIPELPTAPNAPAYLAILAVNNNSVTLQWQDNAQNETDFELQYSTGNETGWTPYSELIAANKTQTTVVVTAGTVYQFRIRAVNEQGNSEWSNLVTMPTTTPAKPAAPAGVKVTVIDSQSIALYWNNVSNATAYRVERSLSSGSGWSVVYSGSSPAFTDANLNSSTKYYYRVYALNDYVPSGASVVAGTTKAEIPNTPFNVQGTALSATSIRITWNSAVHATNYRVEFYNTAKGKWAALGTTTSHSVQHQNLTASTTYQYRVIAVSGAGESAPSSTIQVKTTIALPSAPTKLTGTVIDSVTIDLSWNAVAGATSYRLEYSLTGKSADWKKLGSSTITGTNGKAVNLAAGMKYSFRVFAMNEAGDSKPSNVFSVTLPALTPVSEPKGLTALAESDAKVNLFWNAVANATQYLVERSTDGNTWKKMTTISAVSTEVLLSGHKAATNYYYRVTAKSSAGTSNLSDVVSVTTRIKSPSAPRTTILDSHSVKITWTLVKDAIGYRIEKSLEGSILWESVNAVTFFAGTKEYIDTDCDLNTVYRYRVIALGTNSATDSQASKEKSITTVPEMPTGFSAVSVLDRQIILAWDEVEGAKSYLIEKFNGKSWVSAGTSKTTELTVKLLKPETAYQFRVIAAGKTGKSPASASISVTTAVAVPPVPAKFNVFAMDSDSIGLTWNGAVGATEYTIQRYNNDKKTWETIGTTTGLSYIDTNLSSSAKYSYLLFASNTTGQSKTASAKTATLSAANETTAPSALTLELAAARTLRISFDSPVSGRASYRVEWSLDNVFWTSQKVFTVSNNTISLAGLQSKTTYYVRIRLEVKTTQQISLWSDSEMFSTI
jgi:subtilisin family serine protease